jgi:death-on-curing protein
MDEPQWIEEKSVLDIHEKQLAIHGGMAGLRDPGMLSSALHRPRNLWAYARDSADLAALAAAYATGIARNHAFIDGNKRTAAVVCEIFLELNGASLAASDDQWYEAMIQTASGALPEQDLATWIRGKLAPLNG